ncbi:mono-functional DNA-alkylating methyl methanesulfonate N-term-domain-containing protein [Paraphysoderma sedebokerense]|nr:mono-functional DNA-alkylating methyl methanesulfonate N-term-domain-containing protein [Paraphysoderma sedebokerense]
MATNYVVTAHPASSVSHALKANFTSSDDINLVLSKSTRIEIYTFHDEGLRLVTEVPVYGRILVLESYRPSGRDTDLLFIATERYKYIVLSYDPVTSSIKTESSGDLRDKTGRQTENGQIGIIDPQCSMILLHLYQGLVRALPMETRAKVTGKLSTASAVESLTKVKNSRFSRGQEKEKEKEKTMKVGDVNDSFNMRIDELNIIDMAFLHGFSKPTLCVLYQDERELRFVKTYKVDVEQKELTEGPWKKRPVEANANILIPVPLPSGGLLVVGQETIMYINPKGAPITLPTSFSVIRSFSHVDTDGRRIILADSLGYLHLLFLIKDQQDPSHVVELTVTKMGQTTTPSSISYLDNGFAFIGSHFGDSQLVRLTAEPNEDDSCVEIVDEYPNLAPILDFVVVDIEKQGQGQIVACCGGFKDASVRVVRNGIGITEHASIEADGIKGMWALRSSFEETMDTMLVVTFFNHTVIAGFDEEGAFGEIPSPGLKCDESTLWCGTVLGDMWVQITPSGIYAVNCKTHELLSSWAPQTGRNIILASANPSQAVVALGGGELVYLEYQNSSIVEIGRTQFPTDIGSLDITPIDIENPNRSDTCAVGLWTEISIRLLRLPTLQEDHKELLGGTAEIRSILRANLDGFVYMLCALGDGHMISFSFNPTTMTLSDRKKVSLGSAQVILTPFKINGQLNIFACSDRPAVVYSKNGKLLYSNVNQKDITYMCPFNAPDLPDSLVFATASSYTIGSIDSIQKLHIQKIPLNGESARRIAYQEENKTLALATHKPMDEENPAWQETGYIKLLDAQTYEIRHSVGLESFESPLSVASVTFQNVDGPCYAVGTAFVYPNEDEPTKGRILVYQVNESGMLRLISSIDVPGAVYNVVPFNGKLLASVTNTVRLYDLIAPEGIDASADTLTLKQMCIDHGHILALYLATRGDFVIVGDLMRSISVLLYKPEVNKLEEVAYDSTPNWMTSVESLDQDHFVGTDISFNIFSVRRNTDATTEDDRRRLETVGEFHLGEFINRVRQGSIVMTDPEATASPQFLYASVNGAIHVLATLPQQQFDILEKLQRNLAILYPGVGGLSHKEWRSFSNERKTVPPKGFIDGDLVETILDLSRDAVQDVIQGKKGGEKLNTTVDDLLRLVEDVSRVH